VIAYSFIALYEGMKDPEKTGPNLLPLCSAWALTEEQITKVLGLMFIDGLYPGIYGKRIPRSNLLGCGKKSPNSSSQTTRLSAFSNMEEARM